MRGQRLAVADATNVLVVDASDSEVGVEGEGGGGEEGMLPRLSDELEAMNGAASASAATKSSISSLGGQSLSHLLHPDELAMLRAAVEAYGPAEWLFLAVAILPRWSPAVLFQVYSQLM